MIIISSPCAKLKCQMTTNSNFIQTGSVSETGLGSVGIIVHLLKDSSPSFERLVVHLLKDSSPSFERPLDWKTITLRDHLFMRGFILCINLVRL